MDQSRPRRNARLLWGLVALAALYGGALFAFHTLTGKPLLDGSIGVVLGLYICSRPAGNAVDLLFFDRHALQQLTSGWRGLGWLTLNLLVLAVGWMVIVLGATRFAGRAGG